MKYFATILFVAFLCQNLTEAQTPTYAGLPGPENVLVVFKAPSDTSDSLGIISQAIASYYKTKRNIPSENIIFPGLRLPDTTFSVDGVAHTVGLGQVSDNIRDFDNHSSGTWYATEHAWKYFYQFIALPIKNYLTQHNLTNQIRYIVLCKGVPFKVQAAGDSSAICNVTVDGLLCMLNTNTGGSYENFLHNLYTEYRAHAIPDTSYAKEFIPNPYYNVDPYLTMDYRFVSDRFTGNWKNLNIKLSYLVSHLDGISRQNVYDIIDRSKDADTTNDGWWIIDDDPTFLGAPSHTYMYNAQEYLNELTPNVVYNTSDTWIVDNYDNNDDPVMGYTSWGIHAEDNNPNWHDSTWWVDTLDFQYAKGAVAISNESFNGNSLTTLVWRSGHGLITQFTEQNLHNSGGAGFSGNAWEPFDENITRPDIYFPAYAAGYNQVEAAYMGTPTLAWENIFLGDPLTQIGQIVTIDTLVGTLQADVNNTKVVIPVNGTLTIPNGTNLNILNFGGIKVWGKLIIGSNTSMKVFNHGLIKVEEGGEIVFGNNSSIQTYDESIVDSKGRITCDLGVQINNGSTFKVANEFFTRGTESSPVNIYSGLSFNDIDSLVVKWTNFHNSNIDIANNYRKGLLDIEFSDL